MNVPMVDVGPVRVRVNYRLVLMQRGYAFHHILHYYAHVDGAHHAHGDANEQALHAGGHAYGLPSTVKN